MGSGILSAVIGHLDAAAQKSEHCGHKGKEQDTFHDGTIDDVKDYLFLQAEQAEEFSSADNAEIDPKKPCF